VLDVRLQGKAGRRLMDFWIFIGVLIVWVLIPFAPKLRDVQEKKRKFRESMARRLNGQFVIPSEWHDLHRIEFAISGRKAAVEFLPAKDYDLRTRLVVPLPGVSHGTLHILRAGFGASFLKLFGPQDISVGDREFDAAYEVRAVPESLAAEVFAAHRRARVMASVRRLETLKDPTIDLTRDQLRIEVREEIGHENGVLALVRTAEEFLEFLELEPLAQDIELGEVRIAVDTGCPVCGTTLGATAVRCESCKTPHHAECWKYVGRCSLYACKGKRCVA